VPSKPLLLLTDPAHFEVTYTINPWMEPCAWAENPVGHRAAARHSFRSFAATLIAAGARLEIMPGVAGLPDMVFPANAAVVLDRLADAGILHLHGDAAAQLEVFRGVDHPHPAPTKLFEDAVVGDGLSNERVAIRHSAVILGGELR